jgi:hypothetical protein
LTAVDHRIIEFLGPGRAGLLWAALATSPLFRCVVCGDRGDAWAEDTAAVLCSRSAMVGGGSNSEFASDGWRPDTLQIVEWRVRRRHIGCPADPLRWLDEQPQPGVPLRPWHADDHVWAFMIPAGRRLLPGLLLQRGILEQCVRRVELDRFGFHVEEMLVDLDLHALRERGARDIGSAELVQDSIPGFPCLAGWWCEVRSETTVDLHPGRSPFTVSDPPEMPRPPLALTGLRLDAQWLHAHAEERQVLVFAAAAHTLDPHADQREVWTHPRFRSAVPADTVGVSARIPVGGPEAGLGETVAVLRPFGVVGGMVYAGTHPQDVPPARQRRKTPDLMLTPIDVTAAWRQARSAAVQLVERYTAQVGALPMTDARLLAVDLLAMLFVAMARESDYPPDNVDHLAAITRLTAVESLTAYLDMMLSSTSLAGTWRQATRPPSRSTLWEGPSRDPLYSTAFAAEQALHLPRLTVRGGLRLGDRVRILPHLWEHDDDPPPQFGQLAEDTVATTTWIRLPRSADGAVQMPDDEFFSLHERRLDDDVRETNLLLADDTNPRAVPQSAFSAAADLRPALPDAPLLGTDADWQRYLARRAAGHIHPPVRDALLAAAEAPPGRYAQRRAESFAAMADLAGGYPHHPHQH